MRSASVAERQEPGDASGKSRSSASPQLQTAQQARRQARDGLRMWFIAAISEYLKKADAIQEDVERGDDRDIEMEFLSSLQKASDRHRVRAGDEASLQDASGLSREQIRASTQAMQERIRRFLVRNRRLVDASNVREFLGDEGARAEQTGCARLDVQTVDRGAMVRHRVADNFMSYLARYVRTDEAGAAMARQTTTARQVSAGRLARPDEKDGISPRLREVERVLGTDQSGGDMTEAAEATAAGQGGEALGGDAEAAAGGGRAGDVSFNRPVPRSVYMRLKAVEDRLVAIEQNFPQVAALEFTCPGE